MYFRHKQVFFLNSENLLPKTRFLKIRNLLLKKHFDIFKNLLQTQKVYKFEKFTSEENKYLKFKNFDLPGVLLSHLFIV